MTREELVQADTEHATSPEKSPYQFGTWYPIETAPKNWTRVLIFDGDCEIALSNPPSHARPNGWFCDDDYEVSPTHWMPLPPHPSQGDRDEVSESAGVSLNKITSDSNP